MYRCRSDHLNSPARTKVRSSFDYELGSIIANDLCGDPEPEQDIAIYEGDYFLVFDLGASASIHFEK